MLDISMWYFKWQTQGFFKYYKNSISLEIRIHMNKDISYLSQIMINA